MRMLESTKLQKYVGADKYRYNPRPSIAMNIRTEFSFNSSHGGSES